MGDFGEDFQRIVYPITIELNPDLGFVYQNTPRGTGHAAIERGRTNGDAAWKANVYPMFWLCRAALPCMGAGSVILNTAAIDASGMCLFVAFAVLDDKNAADGLCEMIAAHIGRPFTGDDLMELGKQILRTERDFNTRAGFTAADDRLPAFFYEDKLPPHDVVFTVTDEELDSVHSFVAETAAAMGITVPGK